MSPKIKGANASKTKTLLKYGKGEGGSVHVTGTGSLVLPPLPP